MAWASFAWLAAASLQSHDAVEAKHPYTHRMATIFVDACIKGEARLSPSEASLLSKSQVPHWMRDSQASTHKVYSISGPKGRSHLNIKDYEPAGDDGWAKSCVIYTGGHDLKTAWAVVGGLLSGGGKPRFGRTTDYYEINYPARRYLVHVGRYSMYSVIFTDAEAAKRLALQPRSTRGRATVTGTDWILE